MVAHKKCAEKKYEAHNLARNKFPKLTPKFEFGLVLSPYWRHGRQCIKEGDLAKCGCPLLLAWRPATCT